LGNGCQAGCNFFDMTGEFEFLDRGPVLEIIAEVDTPRTAWFEAVSAPFLESVDARQAALSCGTTGFAPPYFDTGDPADQWYARYDVAVYDRFVIGVLAERVWLGPRLHTLVPSASYEATSGWVVPKPELLGETWPTIERIRPYVERIRNGEVIPWPDRP
jgi:hypothetical protein